MSRTVAAIAEALGFEAEGDVAVRVRTAAHPAVAGPDDLALAMDAKHLAELSKGRAKAALVAPGIDWRACGLAAAIFAPRARYALSGVTALFDSPYEVPTGVHSTAVVADDVEIGEGAAIGPLTVIERGARLGAGVVILGQATIGAGSEIGEGSFIHSGVRIGRRVRLGARAIVHANATIGSDGFSFVTPEPSSVEQLKKDLGASKVSEEARNRFWARIHSLGSVIVGDDVEIGAGAAIDRGTVIDTSIGSGTKLDNLVQIGHNVQIGRNCLLCGQVGVAGSCEIGDRVVLGGQVGVADHARISDDVVVTAQSGVSGYIKSKSVIGGSPAVDRKTYAEMFLNLRRLPRIAREFSALKKRFPESDEAS